MSPLSGSKIPVDQSLLTGGVVQDAEAMFSGDNVMNHLYSLFGRKSVTRFISGDEEVHYIYYYFIVMRSFHLNEGAVEPHCVCKKNPLSTNIMCNLYLFFLSN